MSPEIESLTIGGVRVDPRTMEVAIEDMLERATSGRSSGIHFVNAYSVALADRDASFAAALRSSDMNLVDGAPIALLARMAGMRSVRTPGPDFFSSMLRANQDGRVRHFFIGGSEELLDSLRVGIAELAPRASVVGTHAPPFRHLSGEEEAAIITTAVAADANILWVGLGTPKQDLFIERHKDTFPGPMLGVGAAFAFLAGSVPRAHPVLRRFGLEWLFRLATEPRRLWRRYVLGNTRFLWVLLRGNTRQRQP